MPLCTFTSAFLNRYLMQFINITSLSFSHPYTKYNTKTDKKCVSISIIMTLVLPF